MIAGKDYGTDYANDEKAVFQALIVLRDQHTDNQEEDQKSALKRGDVLAVRKMPHLWSDTERASYLIVPIEMTGKVANELLVPKKDGDAIILARTKKIDLEKIGFTGNQISGTQPL